jgi:hypothetical protein
MGEIAYMKRPKDKITNKVSASSVPNSCTTQIKLSDRVRPNSEASPWVIAEIKTLEAKLTNCEIKLSNIYNDEIGPKETQLEEIEKAIADYHYALDTRQHGGEAQDAAFSRIRQALGKHWKQGEELKKRGGK